MGSRHKHRIIRLADRQQKESVTSEEMGTMVHVSEYLPAHSVA